MEYKEDCFAIKLTGLTKRCSILTEINCEKCKFYKTFGEYYEGLRKYPIIKPYKQTPRVYLF